MSMFQPSLLLLRKILIHSPVHSAGNNENLHLLKFTDINFDQHSSLSRSLPLLLYLFPFLPLSLHLFTSYLCLSTSISLPHDHRMMTNDALLLTPLLFRNNQELVTLRCNHIHVISNLLCVSINIQ